MLARLDEIPGVEATRVDRSGRRFLFQLDAGVDEDPIAARARDELGASAKVLGGSAEADVLASYRRGDTWLRSSETIALSREEARILGARYAEEAAAEIGLSADKAEKLSAVMQREIAAAFERARGSTNPLQAFRDDLGTVSTRVTESARAFLTDEELQGLRAFAAARTREREEPETPKCDPPPDPAR